MLHRLGPWSHNAPLGSALRDEAGASTQQHAAAAQGIPPSTRRSCIPRTPPHSKGTDEAGGRGLAASTGGVRSTVLPTAAGAKAQGARGDHCQRVLPRLTLEERRGGGGVWDPKVCVPKMAQSEFPNCKFRFFPRRSLARATVRALKATETTPPVAVTWALCAQLQRGYARGAMRGDGDRVANRMRYSSALLCGTVLATPKEPSSAPNHQKGLISQDSQKMEPPNSTVPNIAETTPVIFFFSPDQDELVHHVHHMVLETTSRNQGSELAETTPCSDKATVFVKAGCSFWY